ncbi:cyanophycinase [Arsukibacterium sp.]|uniref:cyanophycinase n=1 Tax=Arsukibacterium sp. TaxID=1977258 RepID=UPI002FDB911A
MKKLTTCITAMLLALPVSANVATSKMPDFSMMLIGGGVKTCSSTSDRYCRSADIFSAAAKKHALFQLSEANLAAINSAGFWSEDRIIEQQQTLAVLEFIRSRLDQQSISERDLLRYWRGAEIEVDGVWVAGRLNYASLSEHERNFVFDQLEVPVLGTARGRPNQRLREFADLSQTTDAFSVELYTTFIEMAQQVAGPSRKPRVLVVTASSRDPFAAVDFYTNLLEEAGAEVSWLPLNAAYQAAQQAEDRQACNNLSDFLAQKHGTYQRERVYPDLMSQFKSFCRAGSKAAVEQIRRSDAIFFNGGDQSLTVQALRFDDGSPSPELQQIDRMLKAGQIVVAGTSAGTAVMSGGSYQGHRAPMITNGDSFTALQFGAFDLPAPAAGCDKDQSCSNGLAENHLTYSSAGGLGLFPWGVLDTHFSERGRQGRLIRLLHDSQTRFGFGVDEATALLVGFSRNSDDPEVRMSVIGESGVYVVDMQNATSSGEGAALLLTNVQTHYLTRGDEMELRAGQLRSRFADWKFAPTNTQSPMLLSGEIFERDNYRQLAQLLCSTQARQADGRSVRIGQGYSLKIAKDHTAYSRQGSFRQFGSELQYCSYRNFMLQLQPAE